MVEDEQNLIGEYMKVFNDCRQFLLTTQKNTYDHNLLTIDLWIFFFFIQKSRYSNLFFPDITYVI